MADFGDSTVSQTTLASMFPISYAYLRANHMAPRTPQPTVPLPPERVRPLITSPFSLTYSGVIKIVDLNTELLFLARALCSSTQQSSSGFEPLIVDLIFTDIVLDDLTTPLVIQGIITTGDILIQGSLTLIGIAQIGYSSIQRNLIFESGVTIASLELYACIVGKTLQLPVGSSIVSLLIFGQYSQISLADLSNTEIYPHLTSLLYLNGTDGLGDRDIPIDARGFGAFTLRGLTQPSYPQITTLAVPDPWSVDIEALFPNLATLYVIDNLKNGVLTVPATPRCKYTSLNVIGANEISSLDLTARAGFLSMGIRVVGCPKLMAVVLRGEALSSEPPREYRSLIIERCGLLYLRGTRGMMRAPTTLRLGDHIAPPISVASSRSVRLLDYILQGMPTLGVGSSIPAAGSDYLPSVLVALAEVMPSVVIYPVMQTVEYTFLRPSVVAAADPNGGGTTTTFTQYAGGSNPVVPNNSSLGGSVLTNAVVTASPFGLRYTLKISESTTAGSIITPASPPQRQAAVADQSVRGSDKGALLSSLIVRGSPVDRRRLLIGLAIACAIIILIIIIVALARYLHRRNLLRQREERDEEKRKGPAQRRRSPNDTLPTTKY